MQHYILTLTFGWLLIYLGYLSLLEEKKNDKSCKVLQDYLSLFQFCLHMSSITFAFI